MSETDVREPQPNRVLDELESLDIRVYEAVAQARTPTIDSMLSGLSKAADKSVLWFGAAAVIALFGGRKGRRAAVNGVASIALASATANLLGKQVTHRVRPDRDGMDIPPARWVPMPESTSFPSGHSASAFAFAEGVGLAAPGLALPLRMAATSVSYSRIHVGVHYPGDVVVGALLGTGAATVACTALALARRRIPWL